MADNPDRMASGDAPAPRSTHAIVDTDANQRVWNSLAGRTKGEPIEDALPRIIARYERDQQRAVREYRRLRADIDAARRMLAEEEARRA